MKTLTTLLLFFILFNANAQSLFHEDFENPDSVISSGNIGFAQCTRIAAGGNACDSSSYGIGDSCFLTTLPFSTIGQNTVILSFDHIAKIPFFDLGVVEVSNDSGFTWTKLTSAQYIGSSAFGGQGDKFTEAAYPTWQPSFGSALPDNSWWKHEVFEIGSIVGNSQYVMVRFKLKDQDFNGIAGHAGWYIDNINVGENYFYLNYGPPYINDLSPCNLPQKMEFYYALAQSGYLSDSLVGYINFGDGTDTNFVVHPDTSNFGTFFIVEHYYQQNASYSTVQIITDLLGNILTRNDTIVLDFTTCKNILGKLYWDNNANCVYDIGDSPLVQTKLEINFFNNPLFLQYAYTDQYGNYSFKSPSNGLLPYSLSMVPLQNTVTYLCPTTNSISINSIPSDSNDFAVGCVPGFDLQAFGFMVGMRLIDPVIIKAYPHTYHCQIDSGFFKVILDNKLIFDSASVAGYNISGDTIIWNNVEYRFSNYSIINIYTTKKSNVVHGDTICNTFIAEIKPGDLDPSNNISSTCGIVLNSYDPNYKEVSPAYEIDTNTTTLNYTIHFQNTGNDTAFKVILTDTIDSNLDLSTLNIKGGSHNFSTNVYANRLLAFTFDPILLPDSGANQLASNGFVSYSIKVKSGTPIGTHITNKAYIFFDSNQPIITNATDNVIVAPTAINELTLQDEISVYPNPAFDNVTVKTNQPITSIKVLNLMGELVYNSTGNMKMEAIIPLHNFAKGVYSIIIESKNKTVAKKVIKM